MGKLNVTSYEDFILEGEFEKIKIPEKSFLDEDSVILAVNKFKTERVDKGFALGQLSEGFLTIPTEEGDQVIEEQKNPAFMIIDIWWEREKRAIFGKIILLDSEDAEKMKQSLQQGIECYVSSADIDSYPVKEENSSRVLFRISEIRGFKVSLMSFHNTI